MGLSQHCLLAFVSTLCADYFRHREAFLVFSLNTFSGSWVVKEAWMEVQGQRNSCVESCAVLPRGEADLCRGAANGCSLPLVKGE